MSIIERMQDPELLKAMTVGEKLSGSLIVMVLGIGTCLIVLAIIMFMVKLMHAIFEPRVKKADPAPPAARIDGEAAAVITSAVAEMEKGRPFRVVSIREKDDRSAK